jgi:His-Xaa-Ser system protein HxsD
MVCYLPAEEAETMSSGASAPVVAFDGSTVSLDAIQRAAYAVADMMTVDIAAADGRFICTMYARSHSGDDDELAHRLRAEVIDQTLRVRIAEQTEPLRNLIFALAFSETGLGDPESPE